LIIGGQRTKLRSQNFKIRNPKVTLRIKLALSANISSKQEFYQRVEKTNVTAQLTLYMKYGKYWFHLQKKKKIIGNFHVLGLFILKIRVYRAKKKFRLSRGVAGGFWTKFEAQLAQPC
jgi:hypothetical protein